jgi:hypothetical protein
VERWTENLAVLLANRRSNEGSVNTAIGRLGDFLWARFGSVSLSL